MAGVVRFKFRGLLQARQFQRDYLSDKRNILSFVLIDNTRIKPNGQSPITAHVRSKDWKSPLHSTPSGDAA